MRLAFVVAAEHAGKPGEQRTLARPGSPEKQHPLPRLDAQRHLAHGPRRAPSVPPAPAFARDRRGSGIHALDAQARPAADRPAAKRLSAPVFASARTTSHDPSPPTMMPEIVVVIV